MHDTSGDGILHVDANDHLVTLVVGTLAVLNVEVNFTLLFAGAIR